MNGLVEFLTAAIAEDEAVAQRLLQDLRSQIDDEGRRTDDRGPVTESRMLGADIGAKYRGQSRWNNVARGQYVALLADPARILAECEAKRRIVEIHHPHDHGGEHGEAVFCNECQWDHGDDEPRIDNQPVEGFGTHPCQTLLALALPDAGHPDFEDEWLA